MAEYTFTFVFEPDKDGGYTVTCPALSGFMTEGSSLEEARKNAKDAARTYLENLKKDALSIPENKKVFVEEIAFEADFGEDES